jgi:hypothetical protein
VRSAALPAGLKAATVARVHSLGANASPPPGASAADAAAIRRIVVDSVTAGTRPALIFAGTLVGIGAVLSLLIPRLRPAPLGAAAERPPVADYAGSLEPLDVAPRALPEP